MPNPNVAFNGQELVIPGVYGSVFTTAGNVSNPSGNLPLIFIAAGYGGVPQTAYSFFTQNDLSNAMRGAPSAAFAPFFYNPSSGVSGANQVIYINVSPSTQSSTVISGTLTGGPDISLLTLTSTNYGSPSNLLSYSISTGTVSPGYNLTLTDAYANTENTGYNLGVPFGLAYIGTAASGVTFSVENTTPYPTFSLSSPNSGESFSYILTPENFPTVTSLVNAINGTGFYSAYTISSTNGAMPANQLDIVSSVSLPSPVSGAYNFVSVTAMLNDLAYYVNTYATPYATATVETGVTSVSTIKYSTLSGQFSGATNGVPTSSDYSSALDIALTIPASVVFLDSNAADIVALGVAHARSASQPSISMPRRFVTGPVTGTTISQVLSLSASYNSKETTVAYPGGYAPSPTSGASTLYSSLYTAAFYAGMMAGNPPATPLTNKPVNFTAPEVSLDVSQINELQMGGVMPIYLPSSTNIPTIASDMTSWQNDSNPYNIFNQQVALSQALLIQLINTYQPFIGTVVISAKTTGAAIISRGQRLLRSLFGTIVSPQTTPVITATYNPVSESWAVSVTAALVGQTRFITIALNLTPLNISVSSVSTG